MHKPAPANLPPLVALRAISNGALKSEALPTRIKLLNWGRNESTQGPVIVDETTVEALAANQRALGFDRIALDFQHNTVPGSLEFERTREPREVAAYGSPEVVADDGLYLSGIEWTAAGKAAAKNYADLSPTPSLDEQRRVTFLHSVALVRNGSVFDLSFFEAGGGKKSSPYMNEDGTFKGGFDGCVLHMMNIEGHDKDSATKICGTIANEKAMNADITKQLETLTAQVTALATDLKTLKEAKPQPQTFEVKLGDKTVTLDAGSVAEKVLKLETDLAAQRIAAETAEKEKLVALFAADGKVPLGADKQAMNAEALGKLSLGELKLLHANTPITVPLAARGRAPANEKAKDDTLKGIDRAIAAHQPEVASRRN